MRFGLILQLTIGTLAASAAARAEPFGDPRFAGAGRANAPAAFLAEPADPACTSLALVSTGGPAPRDPHTLAVRWTGVSNFELAYAGHVILLDAYMDRGANFPPLGFKAADVQKADVILLGHGHFDHMSDAASVAHQTGARIVAAPVTVEKLLTQGVPAAQIQTVTGKGGEALKFDGFTVTPILALHGQPDKHLTHTMEAALAQVTPALSPAMEAEEKTIHDRGTDDPRVIDEGTIAYLITFDDGFRIIYRDSGGRVTEYERAAFKDSPGVDLGLVALSADFLNTLTSAQALEHATLYKPDVFMPAHHDAGYSGHAPLWRATEPVFQVLKDADPRIVTVSREYREPTCFDTDVSIHSGRIP